ncbi:IQ and ubiquitin-like domain-containing protein [Caerostris extrusa]|uniref:IQ and ubiquitin-like domain-containing protein n=1 Tax=Caerostris extrusa TaxID=172846 RepID=A0AAV4NIR1_CAEEX|nr:IQ and ubiquitin-like domain-containing protein [Caerostris extrusa]
MNGIKANRFDPIQRRRLAEGYGKRRLHPKSGDDFKLIFSDLQKWWNSETKSISEVRSGADCKAAMWMLLNAEASKIEEAAKSKVWKAYEDTVEVQTSTTLRARYLHDLYQTLSMKYLSAQDRVDVLTNLKKVLKMKTDTDSTPYIMCCAACKCFYIIPINSTEDVLGKSVIENYFIKCKKCRDIENEAWIRKDLELYKRILKLLITEEEKSPQNQV